MNPFENNSRLSTDEAAQFASQVAALSQASLPLSAGLRAVAEEALSPRLAEALASVANQLESGQSLEHALDVVGARLPVATRGLICAASRSGRFGAVLAEMLEQERHHRATWRAIKSALRYPLTVFALSFVVACALPILVASDFAMMFQDGQMKIPFSTRVAMWMGEVAGPWLLVAGLVVVVLLAIGRLVAGERLRRAAWSAVPIVGPMWRWMGLAELWRLLAALLDAGLPLPDALDTAGNGMTDAHAAGAAHQLAAGVRQGRVFSVLLHAARVPAMLAPVIAWGERSAELPQALRTAAEMLEVRVRARALWLRTTLPPLLFVAIGLLVLGSFMSLLMPMVELYNRFLSW